MKAYWLLVRLTLWSMLGCAASVLFWLLGPTSMTEIATSFVKEVIVDAALGELKELEAKDNRE